MPDDKLVTLARFSDPIEAALARNKLVEAGIQAILNNDTAAVATWGLTNAFSTVELLAPERDAEAALEVLRYRDLSPGQIQQRSEARHPEGFTTPDMIDPVQTDITTPEALAEDEEDEEGKEALAPSLDALVDRAFKAALFGLLFCPLQYYSLAVLLQVFLDDREVSPPRRAKMWGAALLDLWGLGWLAYFLLTFLGVMPLS